MLGEVTVDRRTLLATVKQNKKRHLEIVKEAQVGYLQKAREVFETRLKDIVENKIVNIHLNLNPPVSHVKEYDLAGIMLAQRHADDKRIKDCGDAIQHVAVHIDIDMEATQDELGVQIANLEYHKNRHGPLGKTSVLYHGKHLSSVGNSQ